MFKDSEEGQTQFCVQCEALGKENEALRRELAEARKVPGWISVDDRLPPLDDDFVALFVNQGNLRIVAWHSKTHDMWKITGGNWAGQTNSPHFQFWMPLPPPKKERE